MNLEMIIAQQKEKSMKINNLIIDYQCLVELLPQAFQKNAESTPDFKAICDSLNILCDRVKIGIEDLKSLIPSINGNNQI